MFLLDGVDLARQRPRSTGDLLAQDLSGHAQVIGRVPLHPRSAQVDEHVGDAEDRALLIEQRPCDQACRPPGGNGEPGGDLGDVPWLPWAWNAATVPSISALTSSGSAPAVLARGWLRVRKTANGVAGGRADRRCVPPRGGWRATPAPAAWPKGTGRDQLR